MESTLTELRALGCKIEQPLSGGDGIACRIIMPARRLSAVQWQEIFTLIIRGLDHRVTDTDGRSTVSGSI